MREVNRDFTVSIEVPDGVKQEECEIIIEKVSASYLKDGVSVTIPDDKIGIHAEEPFETEE